jgi:hypothetical protein
MSRCTTGSFWRRAQLHGISLTNKVMYNKFRKIVKNNYGPTIFNGETSAFFKNRNNCCLLLQVKKSV